MLFFVKQRLVLMLSMDINQQRRYFFHTGHRYGFRIDFPYAAGSCNFAGHNNFTIFRENIHLCQTFYLALAFYLEGQLYQCIFCLLPQHLLRHLFPQSQIDGANDNGFTSPCFPGKDIQPFPKGDLCFFHQSQIFHMQTY